MIVGKIASPSQKKKIVRGDGIGYAVKPGKMILPGLYIAMLQYNLVHQVL